MLRLNLNIYMTRYIPVYYVICYLCVRGEVLLEALSRVVNLQISLLQ